MGWTDISLDPNSEEALSHRYGQLVAAHRCPVRDRAEHLRALAKGRRVLDIGVADHGTKSVQARGWLHREIASAASYSLGVDVIADAVETIRGAGYNVECRDITRDPPAERFEIAILGEIIEHLGNPAEMLESVRSLLLPGGLAVLTIPNPYEIGRVIHALRGRSRDNVDHVTAWTPSGVVELAERTGFRLEAWCGVKRSRRSSSGLVRLNRTLKEVLAASVLSPESACETLIFHLACEPKSRV